MLSARCRGPAVSPGTSGVGFDRWGPFPHDLISLLMDSAFDLNKVYIDRALKTPVTERPYFGLPKLCAAMEVPKRT